MTGRAHQSGPARVRPSSFRRGACPRYGDNVPAQDQRPLSLASRRDRLRLAIASDPIDGLLISSATNVGYLTGFTGEDATFLLTPDRGSQPGRKET